MAGLIRHTDPRVDAVRADSKVGVGTCSVVDECLTDKELIAYLDEMRVQTPAGAVREMRKFERLKREQERETRYE